MKQENKEFLLKDLCSRLPYRIKCKVDLQGLLDMCDEYKERFEKAKIVIPDLFNRIDKPYCLWLISGDRVNFLGFDGIDDYNIPIELVKPYLLPLSSMTEEQYYNMLKASQNDCLEHMKVEKEWKNNTNFSHLPLYEHQVIDWFNKNHFDYRGLIEKGLAIDATNLNIY